jgi:hypothetical protein
MSHVYKNSFISLSPVNMNTVSFICLMVLSQASNKMWGVRIERVHYCLFPPASTNFEFFTIKYDSSCRFNIYVFLY